LALGLGIFINLVSFPNADALPGIRVSNRVFGALAVGVCLAGPAVTAAVLGWAEVRGLAHLAASGRGRPEG
jgi:hypothetical protein